MDNNSEKERLDLIKKRFRRINIINTLVISVLLGCYAIGFVIYQSIQTGKHEDVLNPHVSSVYENKSLFINTLFDCLDNSGIRVSTSGDFSYKNNSVAIRLGRYVFFYAFSNPDEQKLVTSALIASWDDSSIMPSEVFAIISDFIKTCENSRNREITYKVLVSLGIKNRNLLGKRRFLAVSDTTRYELTFKDKPPYQLILLASPRGSMRNFNFAN